MNFTRPQFHSLQEYAIAIRNGVHFTRVIMFTNKTSLVSCANPVPTLLERLIQMTKA